MNPRKCIQMAEYHRQLMSKAIAPLSERLAEFFGDDNACVFYQSGDGWCLLYGDDERNTPVGEVDFDALFQMPVNEAIEYLTRREV